MKKVFLFLAIFMLTASPALARHKHRESWYQRQWCAAHQGRVEVVFKDKSRADCVTKGNAIEFDFMNKWAESVGQALHYAVMSGKRGGIVLIGPKTAPGVIRVRNIIKVYHLPIDLWTVDE